jgi:hypothetical protein
MIFLEFLEFNFDHCCNSDLSLMLRHICVQAPEFMTHSTQMLEIYTTFYPAQHRENSNYENL